METVAQKTETSTTLEVKTEPTPEPKVEPTPEASPTPTAPPIVPISETPKPEPTPEPKVESTPATKIESRTGVPVNEPAKSEPTPSPTPETILTTAVGTTVEASPKPTAVPEPTTTPKELFPPVIITIPDPKSSKPTENDAQPKAEPSPTPSDTKATDEPKKTEPDSTEKPKIDASSSDPSRPRIVDGEPKPPAEAPRCTISVSEDSISLQNNGGNLAILVGIEGDGDLASLTAKSSSPDDVEIKPGPEVAGLKDRALYVIRSLTARPGVYQVVFEMDCGKKAILVKVR